ncbi:MAG TPA: ATP-dependent DNA ligase [Longimicrobiaceae bacterium]
MALPLPHSYEPMEAELAAALPDGPGWIYEPKWDGFRCLAFRDGDEVELRSKAGKPLGRYFPDVIAAIRAVKANRFVLDGEIVIPIRGTLSFDDLLQRIHPAESRVKKLAASTPAQLIVFDLLVDARGTDLTGRPLEARRAALEKFAAAKLEGHPSLHLSPSTDDVELARKWLADKAAGLDGVMAKRADVPYASGNRTGMLKVKRMRTADCVVGGFRWAKNGKDIGSLLLGLHDAEGKLHHVGFCSALNAKVRKEARERVVALRGGEGFSGRAPGGPSRWRKEGTGEWEALRPELVVEVEYDHFNQGRFRHGTRFNRWRPDKDPAQCRLEQVEREGRNAMGLIDN